MRKILCTIAIVSCIAAGCEKNPPEQTIPAGIYKGSFRRSSGAEASNITLQLSADGKFEGTSEKPQYPAICNGKYSISKDSLTFENGCAFTANFDWTLILNGKYHYEYGANDSLVFYRGYSGGANYFDIYTLKQQ